MRRLAQSSEDRAQRVADELPDAEAQEVWGVCNVCRERVTIAERDARSHPCPDFYVSVGWQALANPRNIPWLPGYHFGLRQRAKNAKGGHAGIRTRVYGVYYEIDRQGLLKWVGGVKPTASTQATAEDMYRRGRTGSNYPVGEDADRDS